MSRSSVVAQPFAASKFETIAPEGREREFERARVLGYSEGFAAGAAKAAEQARLDRERFAQQSAELNASASQNAAQALAALAQATTTVQGLSQESLSTLNTMLLEHAVELAAKLVSCSLPEPSLEVPDVSWGALGALRRALAQAPSSPVVRVLMNPSDAHEIEGQLEHCAHVVGKTPLMPGAQPPSGDGAQTAVHSGFVVVPDPTVARGSASAHYPDGYVDASIDSAFARARAALAGGA